MIARALATAFATVFLLSFTVTPVWQFQTQEIDIRVPETRFSRNRPPGLSVKERLESTSVWCRHFVDLQKTVLRDHPEVDFSGTGMERHCPEAH